MIGKSATGLEFSRRWKEAALLEEFGESVWLGDGGTNQAVLLEDGVDGSSSLGLALLLAAVDLAFGFGPGWLFTLALATAFGFGDALGALGFPIAILHRKAAGRLGLCQDKVYAGAKLIQLELSIYYI